MEPRLNIAWWFSILRLPVWLGISAGAWALPSESHSNTMGFLSTADLSVGGITVSSKPTKQAEVVGFPKGRTAGLI